MGEFLSWIFAASPEQQQPRRLKLEAVPSPSGSKPKLETSLAASRLEYSSILSISCKTSTGEDALSFDVSTDSTVFQLEKRIKSSLAWGCLVLVDAEGKVPTKERLSKYKVLTAKEVATPSYALKGIDTEKCRRCESKDLKSDRFTDWGVGCSEMHIKCFATSACSKTLFLVLLMWLYNTVVPMMRALEEAVNFLFAKHVVCFSSDRGSRLATEKYDRLAFLTTLQRPSCLGKWE